MKNIIFIFFLLIIEISVAQIDSLLIVFNTADNDSVKMESCFYLAEKYLRQKNDLDTFRVYSEIALKIAESNNYEWHTAKATRFIGDYYKRNNEVDTAFIILSKSQQMFADIGDSSMYAQVNFSLAGCYERKNQLDKAAELTLEAARVFERENLIEKLGPTYYNISLTFSKQEDYETAIKYRKLAYQYATKATDKYFEGYFAVQYGSLFGEMYLQGKDSTYADSLLKYVNIGLEIGQKHNIPTVELRALSMLTAYNNAVMKNYDLAMLYANTLIKKAKQFNSQKDLCEGYFKKSDILIELKQYELADKYADSSLQTANEMEWTYYQMVSFERIYDANKKAGNFDAALEAYEKFKTLEDSLVNVEKTEAINDLDKKYQTEKKEREIAELKQNAELEKLKNERQIIAISLVIVILLLVSIFIYFYYKQRVLKKENELSNIKQRLLRAQINPHFFFNALASIQTFFLKEQDGKKAVLYLSKFSKLMRLVLENSSEDYISLDEEIKTLENYLDLQKVRFNDSFEYEIHVDDSLNKFDLFIPPMFAQPFIENSLEHGLLPKNGEGKIDIYFNNNGDSVQFVVEDNGVGVEKSVEIRRSQAKTHKSRATEITKDRLYIINKERGTNIELIINDIFDAQNNVSGTRVVLDLPFLIN